MDREKLTAVFQSFTLIAQLIQYKRDGGIFSQLQGRYKKVYLVGAFLTTVSVVMSYLKVTEEENNRSVEE